MDSSWSDLKPTEIRFRQRRDDRGFLRRKALLIFLHSTWPRLLRSSREGNFYRHVKFPQKGLCLARENLATIGILWSSHRLLQEEKSAFWTYTGAQAGNFHKIDSFHLATTKSAKFMSNISSLASNSIRGSFRKFLGLINLYLKHLKN